ncbi:hypothetical protein OGAPHI_007276 [Ogataea philodendri]|uniref:Uncharacterized protein n=1 Tax=Ogataea philodendri TaxID=1378263 RepID=A0A9P8NVM6_9ASCO|nr:uncharacterized protein OGAPHI_007276 [Ogataea philodendri]KAH3660071.1 hypothetical protein OGAPHI_007276 [Ogataea philodendri]
MSSRLDDLIGKLSSLTVRSQETLQTNTELSQTLHNVRCELVANENKIVELNSKIESTTEYWHNLTSLALRTQLLEAQTLRDEENGLSWRATETTFENLEKEYRFLNGQSPGDQTESDLENESSDFNESNEVSIFSINDHSESTIDTVRDEHSVVTDGFHKPVFKADDEPGSEQVSPVRGFDAPYVDAISELEDSVQPELSVINQYENDCPSEILESDRESVDIGAEIIDWYRLEPRCSAVTIGVGRPVVANAATDMASGMSFKPKGSVEALSTLVKKRAPQKPLLQHNWIANLIPNSSLITSETGRIIGQPAAHTFPRSLSRNGAHSTMVINRTGRMVHHGSGSALGDVLTTRVSHAALRDALQSSLDSSNS